MNFIITEFNNAIQIIEKNAPTIAALLNAASSSSHSVVLPILASAFGSSPSNLLGLISAIMSTPEAEAKLQQLEQAFIAHLQKIV